MGHLIESTKMSSTITNPLSARSINFQRMTRLLRKLARLTPLQFLTNDAVDLI